jgi:hypothetical protein
LKIQYLHNKDIDSVLWDECVSASGSNLIYGKTFFLDAMIPNWEAVVINDYSAVMPIPVRKKMGIKYIHYAAFTQQLGVFTNNLNIDINEIILAVAKRYNYGQLYLNHANGIVKNITTHTNYILPLNINHEQLYLNYKNDLKKNLKIAQQNNIIYTTKSNIELAIELYKNHYSHKHPEITDNDYKNLLTLTKQSNNLFKAYTRAAIGANNEVYSIALILEHNHRLYNILNTTTASGKQLSSNHFLLNEIIKEFSESNYILDFEGSDLPGVKSFYQKFSPKNEPYYIYKFNKLPFPLNILKK